MGSTQETILPNDTLKVPHPMPREIDVVHRTHQRSPIPGYDHIHFKFVQARLGRLMTPKHLITFERAQPKVPNKF
jgi:hypothetical protein